MDENNTKLYAVDDEFSTKGTKPSRDTQIIKKSGPRRNSYVKNNTSNKRTSSVRRPASKDKVSTAVHKNTHAEKDNGKFSTHGRAAFIIAMIVMVLVVGTFSAFVSYTYLVDKYSNPVIIDEIDLDEDTKIEFRVEKGATTAQIADSLKSQGLIENTFIYKLMSKFNGYDGEYKSGVHYLSKGLSLDEIMAILSDEPLTVKVTFPEGFTTLQIAERLEANEVCSKDEFLSKLNELDYSSYQFIPEDIGDMDYIVDGYLFPDTYLFEIHSSVETVVYKMLNRFNDVFLPEYYNRIEKMGLTINQVVTIASYVEKEAKVYTEREMIARVYYNRLVSEDLRFMQCEATIFYVLKKNGITRNYTMTGDTKIEDPYNTYLNEGLTPGAICSPSEASIKSVITMDPHEYYYYCLKADGSGTHVFSKTFEEHQKAVEELNNG